MKKVLYIAHHRRDRSPGQRFRFEQFTEALLEEGYAVEMSPLIRNAKEDKAFYGRGNYFFKLFLFIRGVLIRFKDVLRANKFDFIVIYREAIMVGSPLFERWFSKSDAKIIYDFDDAIWLNTHVSEGNRWLKWVKNPGKVKAIIKLSDLVTVGNRYLAEYAMRYNKNTKVIPTTIDTSYHRKPIVGKRNDGNICIGWTGTFSTLIYFETILPVLEAIKKKYAHVYFKIIADVEKYYHQIDTKTTLWKKESEIADLSEFDIGIMPLSDDKWTRGKCGFKGIQYMALEIPTVMAAVGVNNEIIDDGHNGYLAKNDNEWFEKLEKLIKDETFREKMGQEGKKAVERKYSLVAVRTNFLACFQ